MAIPHKIKIIKIHRVVIEVDETDTLIYEIIKLPTFSNKYIIRYADTLIGKDRQLIYINIIDIATKNIPNLAEFKTVKSAISFITEKYIN